MSSIWATARCFSVSVARNASAASATAAAFGEASNVGAGDGRRGGLLDDARCGRAEAGREKAERHCTGRGESQKAESVHRTFSCCLSLKEAV